MLVYSEEDLTPIRCTDSDFRSDPNSRKSTPSSIFPLREGDVVWRSVKQTCIVEFTMKAKYVVTWEVA